MRTLYPIGEFTIDGSAPPRHGERTWQDERRREASGFCRCIGGDKGDLLFDGYSVDNGSTTLVDPTLATTIDDLSDDEAMDIAHAIFSESFASIGWEALF